MGTRSKSFHLSRRALLLAFAAAPANAVAAPCPPPRVLFICPAGTVKSPIARELLEREARRRGVPVDVRSRAIAVADHVSAGLAARLDADEIHPAAQPAEAFTLDDVAGADIVVAFDAAADDLRLRRPRVWRTPSWNADYDTAKADMLNRIAALADELERRPANCR